MPQFAGGTVTNVVEYTNPLIALSSQPSSVVFDGTAKVGGVVSCTVMVCVFTVGLLQTSFAVKVRVTTTGQVPLLLS